ncbi:hypothetical protein KKC97_06440 [bacterium]|nr:hypothetical protein [bacterium]MBU1637290.1 hypothetical protein [bacterium]
MKWGFFEEKWRIFKDMPLFVITLWGIEGKGRDEGGGMRDERKKGERIKEKRRTPLGPPVNGGR